MTHETLFILSSAAALVLMVVAVLGWQAAGRARRRVAQLEVEMASSAHYAQELAGYKTQLDAEQSKRIEAEKQVSLMKQRVDDMALRQKDLEDFKQMAKASLSEMGASLSSKLLEDHKREAKLLKEEQEKITKQSTEQLLKNMQTLTKEVAGIQSHSKATATQVEVVMRALTNPSGAGQMAEVGLENALKNLGLEPERDYVMQFHIAMEEGSNLRPDAVIFLSQDMVVVIDSKASKHMIELAEAEGSGNEEAVLKSLLTSMHRHLDALSRKQYADAVAKLLKERGRKFGRMVNVMYLPTESLIEKLRKADGTIATKCQNAGIVLAGPASLATIFSLSRQAIAEARQQENQQQIVAVVRELMDATITALSHVDGVGKGMSAAAEKLDKFARSLNRFVLPKMRNLQQLGVEPAKGKALPTAIATYEVRRSDDVMMLEVEPDAEPLKLVAGE